ncbi:MAG: DUF1289 domain-containing protein [Pseudomonadota bacterium]
MTTAVEAPVAPPRGLATPCVGVCRIDPETRYCSGCARTSDEISRWSTASEDERQAIWNALPERFDALGVQTRRLPWSGSQAMDFVERSIKDAAGTWVLGVLGAVGEFTRTAGETLELRRRSDQHGAETLEAVVPRAALRLHLDDSVRTLIVEAPDTTTKVVLAVKRAAQPLEARSAVTDLGLDANAIVPEAHDQRLFDLGIGRSAAQFCVRSETPTMLSALESAQGVQWPDWLSALGPTVIAESPVRVIKTRIGRVEIDAPIPAPGGASPPGPHTHLLPAHLAQGLDAPADLQLPEAYVPGAVFYPTSGEQSHVEALLSGVATSREHR